MFDSHYVKSVSIRSYSGPHFPAFGLNIQSECGKMQTRITPNTDTFHAVSTTYTRVKVFKNGPNEICGRQPLKIW